MYSNKAMNEKCKSFVLDNTKKPVYNIKKETLALSK